VSTKGIDLKRVGCELITLQVKMENSLMWRAGICVFDFRSAGSRSQDYSRQVNRK
jgi:hypothetical protein